MRSIVVIWVKIFKTEKTIEIHLVRLTDVCGKVLRIDTGDMAWYVMAAVKRLLLNNC